MRIQLSIGGLIGLPGSVLRWNHKAYKDAQAKRAKKHADGSAVVRKVMDLAARYEKRYRE